MLHSALEQFQIFPVFYFLNYNISITNQLIYILLIGILFYFLFTFVISDHLGFIIPGRFQLFIELLYITIINIIYENTGKMGIKFFPFIFTICLFIFLANIIGLIPYSFTVTSHLVVTLTFSLILFIGVISLIVQIHNLRLLQLFLPQGTSLFLAFLLIPIEIISFIFKPLSLGVRLFANIIAGHTLLKVIGGFSWTIILKGGGFFFLHFLPLFILILLIGLEFGVALIQTYVFLILISIYFREAINLH